jgi:hypothetical protein
VPFNEKNIFLVYDETDVIAIKRAYSKNVAGYIVKDEKGNRYKKLSELLETYSDTVALPSN